MTPAVVHLTVAPLPAGADAAERSAVTRALLRSSAADRTGIPAEQIAVVARCPSCGGAHGRPELVRDGRPIGVHASVSRSGPWGVVAVADVPVGVDIEQVSRTAFAGFDEVALSGDERAAVRTLAPDARAAARAALWTAKEALLKVSGSGLRIAPSDISLGRSWDGTVVDDPGRPGRPVGLVAVDVDAGYCLAVAGAGGLPIVRVGRTEVSPAAVAPGSRRAIR